MEQGYVTINLGGQEIKLRPGDDPDKIKALSDYINAKINEVTGGKSSVTLNVALLVALNITEELFDERQRHDELLYKIREKALILKEKLDNIEEQSEKT